MAEPLGAEGAHEGVPRRREERLLAHGGRVRDVGDGHEAVRGGFIPSEQDVQRGRRLERGADVREVGRERRRGGDAGPGHQRFVVDGDQEAALGGVGDQTVEGGQELGGCCDRKVSDGAIEERVRSNSVDYL